MRALKHLRNKECSHKPIQSRQKKVQPSMLRVLNEWNEWEDIPGVRVELSKGIARPDLFNIYISPHSGYWKGGTFKFKFEIPVSYPMDPPSVHCLTTPIYHPNIDTNGNICLNLLRPNWLPINTFANVIYGLILLFDNPNFNDPLPSGLFLPDMEPFELHRKNKLDFENMVTKLSLIHI